MSIAPDLLPTYMRAAEREAKEFIAWLGEKLPPARVTRINDAVAQMLRNKDLGADTETLAHDALEVANIVRADRLYSMSINPYMDLVKDHDVEGWFNRGALGFRERITRFASDLGALLPLLSENTRELCLMFKNLCQTYEEVCDSVCENERELQRHAIRSANEYTVASIINAFPPSLATDSYVSMCKRRGAALDTLAQNAFKDMIKTARHALALEEQLTVKMFVVRDQGVHEDYATRAGLTWAECHRLQEFITRYGGGEVRRRVVE